MNQLIQEILSQINTVILGKDHQVRLALACLVARGHLLIEDLPGMGKTTLSQALAAVLGLSYERVQFTSDLLPADILGVSVYDKHESQFLFHAGPIFTQILLADEINRTTPKTQSALLEAMEERQVTVEGKTRPLPNPFFVIATQNPLSQAGTYPLPESQLDRFLMRISLGYPDKKAERQLFEGIDPRQTLKNITTLISPEQLIQLQDSVDGVKATGQLLDYLQRIVDCTRMNDMFNYGLSPRGAIALLRAAKAWALIDNREYLLPDDIQTVMPAVVGHRVRGGHQTHLGQSGDQSNTMVDYLLTHVEVVDV